MVEKSAEGNERRRLDALAKKKPPVPAVSSSKAKLEQATPNITSEKGVARREELVIEDLGPFEDVLRSRTRSSTSIGLAAAEVRALQARESSALAGLSRLVSDRQSVADDLVLRMEAEIRILRQMERRAQDKDLEEVEIQDVDEDSDEGDDDSDGAGDDDDDYRSVEA